MLFQEHLSINFLYANLRVLASVSLGTQPTSVGTGCDLRMQTLKWDFGDASSTGAGSKGPFHSEMLKLSLVMIWAGIIVEENTFVRAFIHTRRSSIR